MKKLGFVIIALFGVVSVFGQHQVNSFFDDMGIVRLETQELSEAADTIISVFHRADDVVWSRTVYRIIDMRFRQNYQLYNPVSSEDPQYSSLFKVMLSRSATNATFMKSGYVLARSWSIALKSLSSKPKMVTGSIPTKPSGRLFRILLSSFNVMLK